MEWFSDNLSFLDMRDKPAAEKVGRYWIVEMAELEGANRAAWESVKAFVSRQDDTYRAVYEKHVTSHKRGCISVDTTNMENFLYDTMGNRRFWPINCYNPHRKYAWDLTKEEIDWIWAGALYFFRQERYF